MTGGGSGHEGGRALKTRVKTARKRSLSSTLWLQRQLNDPFVAQAKREGYRSRAAYKLLEMAEKYKLFRPGGRIVEAGLPTRPVTLRIGTLMLRGITLAPQHGVVVDVLGTRARSRAPARAAVAA